jgi:uncharacterized membrane protein
MRPFNRIYRRGRRLHLRLGLFVGVPFRRLLLYWRRNRRRLHLALSAVLTVLLGVVLVGLAVHYKSALKVHAEALSVNGTLSQLGIAVGAAMLGVIGIVFSLNLFSIQQVAERGTLLTLREYANDWVLQLVYWSLAAFSISAVTVALFGKRLAFYSLSTNFAILGVTVVLMKIYFNRAIKFSDPHFTVSKIAKRGRKFLGVAQRLERAVEAEVRYARRKRKV